MSDDLIRRQAALDDAHRQIWYRLNPNMKERIDTWLVNLPAVQPKQKTGRWIYKERNILINTGRVSYGENGAVQEKRWAKVKKPYCSECGWYENSEYEATPYCPNCGAKMESEDVNND